MRCFFSELRGKSPRIFQLFFKDHNPWKPTIFAEVGSEKFSLKLKRCKKVNFSRKRKMWYQPCPRPLWALSTLIHHNILLLPPQERLDPSQGLPSPPALWRTLISTLLNFFHLFLDSLRERRSPQLGCAAFTSSLLERGFRLYLENVQKVQQWLRNWCYTRSEE